MNNNDALLQRASDLAENGQYDLARKFVIQAIKNDKSDVEAWWAMTHVASSDDERNHAINRVLSLAPDHPHALLMRDQIRAGSIPSLGKSTTKAKVASSESVDFMPKVAITLVAYFVLYIVGLGLNIYFLYDARQFQRQHGYRPQNTGCLWAMLGVFGGLVLFSCLAFFGFATIGLLFG